MFAYNQYTGGSKLNFREGVEKQTIQRLQLSYPVQDVEFDNVTQFKRKESQVFQMLAETFPSVPEETVAEVLLLCNDDFVLAAEELSDLQHNG